MVQIWWVNQFDINSINQINMEKKHVVKQLHRVRFDLKHLHHIEAASS